MIEDAFRVDTPGRMLDGEHEELDFPVYHVKPAKRAEPWPIIEDGDTLNATVQDGMVSIAAIVRSNGDKAGPRAVFICSRYRALRLAQVLLEAYQTGEGCYEVEAREEMRIQDVIDRGKAYAPDCNFHLSDDGSGILIDKHCGEHLHGLDVGIQESGDRLFGAVRYAASQIHRSVDRCIARR